MAALREVLERYPAQFRSELERALATGHSFQPSRREDQPAAGDAPGKTTV